MDSTHFQQLRRVFYKLVRCGKYILSAANRGFIAESYASESDKRAFGRSALRGLLLLEARITCYCPRMKNNDGVITLTSE
jgi:hypothetical protein